MKIADRAMQVHGKVCMIETRDESGKGMKHSLFLSVFREMQGRTYILRRCAYSSRAKETEVIRVFVHD